MQTGYAFRRATSAKRLWTGYVTADLTTTIQLAQEVIDFWQKTKAAGRPPDMQINLDEKVDSLLGHLLETYNGDFQSLELNGIFSDDLNHLNADYLRRIPRSLIPIAVMREVLKKHRVLFTPGRVPNWREFSGRYGRYILTA